MTRTWEEGARLLRRRVDSIPGLLREWAESPAPTLGFDGRGVRRWVVTGIGSSAAHARFLAHLLADRAGVAARFASTASLAKGAPKGAENAGLIVFSQGMSPNARFALGQLASWYGVVLVTAVRPDRAAAVSTAAGFVAHCQAQGVSLVALPEAVSDEYQTLVRVMGPALGYAAGIALARVVAGVTAGEPAVSDFIPELSAARLEHSVEAAATRLSTVFPQDEPLSPLFGREVVLLSAHGYGELIQNLRGKLMEGMGLPQPALWDLLEFAHGGYQRIYRRSATLIALLGDDGCAASEAPLLEGLRAVLQPARHDLRVLRALLPLPWSVFEHEAACNELVLRWIDERERDPRRWPGRGSDAPLYELAPATPATPAAPANGETAPASRDKSTPASAAVADVGWSALEDHTWPEVERALAEGRRTVVIPLGSTEQHGPHLPFATDSWIADALAERFCQRVPEALRIPAISLGCASEHLDFPGTLSLSADSLEQVLADCLAALSGHGFESAFLFSAHGGNLSAMRSMEQRLREVAAPLRLIVYSDLEALVQRWHDASHGFGVSPEQSGHHAGEFETSIIAALRPGAVRWSQLDRAVGVLAPLSDAQSLFYPSLRNNSPSGVVGDPRGARAARGARYLEVWSEALVECYRAAQPAQPDHTPHTDRAR